MDGWMMNGWMADGLMMDGWMDANLGQMGRGIGVWSMVTDMPGALLGSGSSQLVRDGAGSAGVCA